MAAFAVMSDHYQVFEDRALSTNNSTVVDRWPQLYPTNPLIKRLSTKEPFNDEKSQHLCEKLAVRPHELTNVSHFVALVN